LNWSDDYGGRCHLGMAIRDCRLLWLAISYLTNASKGIGICNGDGVRH
jgi:hypothetical protein